MPSSRTTARDCAANASFSSKTSIWSTRSCARASAVVIAGHRAHSHVLGLDPNRRIREHAGERRLPRSRAQLSVATTSAAAPSLMPEALPAVTVPSFVWNAALSAASFSTVVPARGYSSRSTRTGAPFRCGISTGTISSANRPSLTASLGARLALRGETVLFLSAHPVLHRDRLGGVAHVAPLDRAREPLGDHGVQDLAMAHPVPPPGSLQQVRRVAHRLCAAGDDHIHEAGLHAFDRVHDGRETRAAHAVHRLARHAVRQPGLERRLPGDVHALAGLQHTPENHVAHVLIADARTADRLAHDNGAEVGSGQILQGAPERTDGRATGGEKNSGDMAGSRIASVTRMKVGPCEQKLVPPDVRTLPAPPR